MIRMTTGTTGSDDGGPRLRATYRELQKQTQDPSTRRAGALTGERPPGRSCASTAVLSQRRTSRLANSVPQPGRVVRKWTTGLDEDGRSQMKEERVTTRRAPPARLLPSLTHTHTRTHPSPLSLRVVLFWTELYCPFQSYFDRLGPPLVFSLTASLFVSRRICRLFA